MEEATSSSKLDMPHWVYCETCRQRYLVNRLKLKNKMPGDTNLEIHQSIDGSFTAVRVPRESMQNKKVNN